MTAFLSKIGKRGSETMIYQIRWQSFILQILDINIKMSKKKRIKKVYIAGKIGEDILSDTTRKKFCRGRSVVESKRI